MPIEIVHFILLYILGPTNYCRGIEYLKTLYDVPFLTQLLEAISTANRFGKPVQIESNLIYRGMEELKRILDFAVDQNNSLNDNQKQTCKSANAWFVDSCHRGLLSRCLVGGIHTSTRIG